LDFRIFEVKKMVDIGREINNQTTAQSEHHWATEAARQAYAPRLKPTLVNDSTTPLSLPEAIDFAKKMAKALGYDREHTPEEWEEIGRNAQRRLGAL